MSEFIEVPSFSKKWKALGFTDDDMLQLQQYLLRNPEAARHDGRNRRSSKNQIKDAIALLKKECEKNRSAK